MTSNVKKRLIVSSGIAVTVAGGLLWTACHSRAENSQMSPADDAAIPTVAVEKVTREDLFRDVTIPAEFRPYVEVELHAKVSGYVDRMNVDFGDKVKRGQLLATIEVPELQDELHNAMATEQKAEADCTNANLIYSRLRSVNKAHPNLVAEQDLDTATANYQMAVAAIAEAKAKVGEYRTLVGYTRITAPFDGVVTHRYADPGALIQAGTSSDTQSLPLVRVSDNYLLRLDFPVDQNYVQDVHVGDPVQVRVDSLGGKMFSGTVSRFTYDITDDTRTMITEVEVPNPKLEIDPGMYCYVDLRVENHTNVLAIPAEAVISGETTSVYVVNSDKQIEERPVQLGLETPDKYEVLSGLKEGELVVVGNHSEIESGQKVEPKIVELSMLNEN
ncbi:MAG TPA: efflux RND transporter periplasmic adaptor subunit [Candidatus Sulfotelmatobacter sp.]|nr:efflux RND transporter periplasmic adaptor subunit [Candidatus Sulfotelmatobacter sp.]